MEAEGNDPPRARHALEQIGRLYAVEEKIMIGHREGGGVVRLRREESYPIIKGLEKWCRQESVSYTHLYTNRPPEKR